MYISQWRVGVCITESWPTTTDQHWWYGIVNGADQLSRGQQIEGKAYFDVGVVQPSKLKSKTNFVIEPTDIYIYI